MHIDAYSFGRIVIDRETYTADVIVFPDRVDSSWWRQEGHNLQERDLIEVAAAEPDILVIGTGDSGVMHVPEGTIHFLESKGIQAIVERTGKAVVTFNNQPRDKKVMGVFHLTC